MSLASVSLAEGRALVVAANKADISGVSAEEYRAGVQSQVDALLPDTGAPPVIPVCSLTGYGVDELMNAVSAAA
ncbi:hypothetical protein JKP88DRAFT_214391 [Tribonema minus]|uniref:Uncharacterized protein n=1 Tax=Tribonema minus TaxID=303371 RepID=A0A835ZHE0_9STRA|nr:hypothetical protein JKP88DRAFT_214391 [Tribonema minus]